MFCFPIIWALMAWSPLDIWHKWQQFLTFGFAVISTGFFTSLLLYVLLFIIAVHVSQEFLFLTTFPFCLCLNVCRLWLTQMIVIIIFCELMFCEILWSKIWAFPQQKKNARICDQHLFCHLCHFMIIVFRSGCVSQGFTGLIIRDSVP